MAKKKLTPREKARTATKAKMRTAFLQLEAMKLAVKALEATLKELSKAHEESTYQESSNAQRQEGEESCS